MLPRNLELTHLIQANAEFDRRYPGASGERQPVHSVYGGAQRFRAGTVAKLGRIACDTLRTYLPDASTLERVTGMSEAVALAVHPRLAAKLQREPVEDFRIDFEDGYGVHNDTEEDNHAAQSSAELVRAMRDGTLPPFIGIRIKSLSAALWQRALKTLDRFLVPVLDAAGVLPPNFVVTLPKVTVPGQVTALDEALGAIEERFGQPARSTRIELMIETPQVICNERGVCAIPALIEAAHGRCRGLHFGPYDYTSSIGITGSHQSLDHPSCDFARHVMQAATAGTGVFLSDGPTKTIPKADNPEAVHRAMRVHYDDVRRSLHHGYYQGWDLHPAQFPMRYAAVYAFFLEGLESAGERLRNFLDAAAQATTLGTVFDDAASAQGLVNYFLTGWSCGALDESDLAPAGVTLEELRLRSFALIMERRRA